VERKQQQKEKERREKKRLKEKEVKGEIGDTQKKTQKKKSLGAPLLLLLLLLSRLLSPLPLSQRPRSPWLASAAGCVEAFVGERESLWKTKRVNLSLPCAIDDGSILFSRLSLTCLALSLQPPKTNTQKQYDLSVGTFSPDGRVFQTDYAQKAVDNGG